MEKAYEKCGNGSSRVDVPIMGYSRESEDMITELLSRGFMLDWIASNCSLCNSTGGKCGYDFSTFHFKCYCPDRPHAARCDPMKDFRLRVGNEIPKFDKKI
ncbi:hypothetical protein TIFTF001_046643 [Ficus carica]|uniref:Wall-associated receptor kinase C-terminal domain-containing protein n=1 Tax=Ficus carica TaxID=3494 RepID=A0AA87ZFH0_FICCA|nr:hypothetical protein TIFTF001_046638 [Ficus carica]GMN32872.1 hypothetical protein TIFTF001_046639 [Ficus carica]GMN32883.1 hypothetical protein TIFTF001_046642 [Ficus carica]GMN32895.1 hypothetical protein TIFTF001_046643 [Ficus carica]